MSDTLDKRQQANLLAGHAGCDHRTAMKWLNHEKIMRSLEVAMDRAAKALDIDRGAPPPGDDAAGAAE